MAEMSMVEKVANAIAVADLNASAMSLPDVSMEAMAEYMRLAVEDGHYKAMARAAIEAMKRPVTDAMIIAGTRAVDNGQNVSEIFDDMIDAALNGKEG